MMGEEATEALLDRVVRGQLVVDPPPELQAGILASVLSAVARDTLARTARARSASAVQAAPAGSAPRPLSLAAYALLGLVVALYAGLVGSLGGPEWPLVLARQGVYALSLVLSSPASWLLLELAQGLAEHAVWLAFLPIVWYLWESDRASARQT
jgi:hypothetical protein